MAEEEANVEHGFISKDNNFAEFQNWVKVPSNTSTKVTLFQCSIEFYWLMHTVMGNPFWREGNLIPNFNAVGFPRRRAPQSRNKDKGYQ